jgi:co-chaperonin GroES (HSP10)
MIRRDLVVPESAREKPNGGGGGRDRKGPVACERDADRLRGAAGKHGSDGQERGNRATIDEVEYLIPRTEEILTIIRHAEVIP